VHTILSLFKHNLVCSVKVHRPILY